MHLFKVCTFNRQNVNCFLVCMFSCHSGKRKCCSTCLVFDSLALLFKELPQLPRPCLVLRGDALSGETWEVC